MKNLIPLRRKLFYWDNIVNAMNHSNRGPLQLLRGSVITRFTEYRTHAKPNRLEIIPASVIQAPNISQLRQCYDSGSTGINVLKQRVKDKQPDILKGECQYCNMGEPSTIDHYLPQKYFPEFSALSINLIPCCGKCNTAKGEEWLVLGNRRIINYYYDDLPLVQYLFCEILFRRGVPRAVFSLDITGIGNSMGEVITNHFVALHLLDRYKERSAGEIMEVYDAITLRTGSRTLAQIRTELISDANALKTSRGQNYWRAILKIALANSDQFLLSAGFHNN